MKTLIELLHQVDPVDIVITSVLKEGVKQAFQKGKELLSNNAEKNPSDETLIQIVSDEDQMLKRIGAIMDESSMWCNRIQFKDLSKPKALQNAFISLDFYLAPVSTHIDGLQEDRVSLDKVIADQDNHIVIIGGPGAGKSTLANFITIYGYSKMPILCKRDYSTTLLIRLREFNNWKNEDNFLEILLGFLGLDLDINLKRRSGEYSKGSVKDLSSSERIRRRIILQELSLEILDELNIILILDGLDEITNQELRKSIISELRKLCNTLKKTRIILTSRTGEYNSNIENTKTLEICPLTDSQIENFINKWLEDPDDAKKLYDQIKGSPFYDTALRPINLAHLCALYLRYKEIPKQPKTIYDKVVTLLLEDWDAQRDIVRISNYSNFATSKKREFLSALAYTLTYKFKSSIFNRSILSAAYIHICEDFGLPKSDATNVIKEIESHTGLFINSGSDKFEFSHKSLQEFLCADFIVRSPDLFLIDHDNIHMPSEYAIAVSLSSQASKSLFILVNTIYESADFKPFIEAFITRLLLEKPDFSNIPQLAGAIASIFTLIKGIPKIYPLFNSLLDLHPNIENSIRTMSHYYTKYGNAIVIANTGEVIEGEHYQLKHAYRYSQGYGPNYNIVYINDKMFKWYLEWQIRSI